MFVDVNPLGHEYSGLTEPILTQFPGPHLHLCEQEQLRLESQGATYSPTKFTGYNRFCTI